MVYLIGPGGAGKSTAGALLASVTGRSFCDLDAHFTARCGDVDQFIATFGYPAYVRTNVEVYLAVANAEAGGVLAFSSGFMTYAADCHPQYGAVREFVLRHPATFVLLPSLDLERCVAETVRRQTRRGAGRTTAARAEAVIRERFTVYAGLGATMVTTMRQPIEVVTEIASRLSELNAPHHLTALEDD